MKLVTVGGVAAASGWRLAFAAAGAQTPAGSTAFPPCVVQPELEEGPFFVDHQINRSDVRSDPSTGRVSAGVPLGLAFTVSQIGAGECAPLAGATVDIWHCDAAGVYSGVGGPGQVPQPSAAKFLRGFQITDANGRAQFTTIYPGWYNGRAVHVHVKIRTTAAPAGAYEFTSQLFFDDALTDRMHARAPYAAHGTRDTRNTNDGIYQSGGAQMMLRPTQVADGLSAGFAIGLDLSDAAVGAPDGGRMGGPGRGPGRGPGFGPGRGFGRG